MFKQSLFSRLCILCIGLLLCTAVQAKPMGARGSNFLYQVEPGDTLEQLARRYTLNRDHWKTLQRLNHIDDPYALPVGQTLKIPLALIPTLPSEAAVIYVTGRITDGKGRALEVGDILRAGQSIKTDASGSATLTLSDQSRLTLGPDTVVRIDHLRVFEGTRLSDTILIIERGTIDSQVAPEHQGVGRFEVRTPMTVTGVRGTHLRVRLHPTGSAHEVLAGQAATQGATQPREQHVAKNQGIVYSPTGRSRGPQPLLPAPSLGTPSRAGGGWRIPFTPVPHAITYRIRVADDEAGTLLNSMQLSRASPAIVTARGGGARYVFVRGIDASGLEGRETSIRLDFPWGVISSDGTPVLSGFGAPLQRRSFD